MKKRKDLAIFQSPHKTHFLIKKNTSSIKGKKRKVSLRNTFV